MNQHNTKYKIVINETEPTNSKWKKPDEYAANKVLQYVNFQSMRTRSSIPNSPLLKSQVNNDRPTTALLLQQSPPTGNT